MKKTSIKELLRGNARPVLLVFVSFLAMVLVSYLYVSHIVSDQAQTIGEEILNTTETAVTGNLHETSLFFSNASQTVESMLRNGRTNQEVLTFLEGLNTQFSLDDSPLPDFLKIYAYIRGEFLDGSRWVPPEDYMPWQRPWYIGAEHIDDVFFSEPYLDADTGGMCISFSKRLLGLDGEVFGIVAVDLDLSRVTQYVDGIQVANNGYGVLLSDQMVFFGHRDPSLIGVSLAEAGGSYDKLAAILAGGEVVSAVRFTDADGVDSIAFLRPIFNGWYLGIITPRNSYYAPVYQMGVALALLGFVLMAILSYLLVRTRYEKRQSDEENRSKSDFLSRMSHEMRTPMNAIIGMTEIARKSEDPERIAYCLDKISDASTHLLGVINDVLDMSKIEAGKLELSEEPFAFREMVQQVAGVMHFKFEEKKQRFTCDVAGDVPPMVMGDRQRLAQVLTNLLSNANKFTPEEGSIRLAVDTVVRGEETATLRIVVEDSGIGISPEQQSRLFRSFEQADVSISRKYGGTGLGLSISKRIVDMMGGEALIESELGKGSRFIFTIPMKIAPMPAVDAPPVAPIEVAQPVFPGKRILLAEDVEINREVLLALLEGSGLIFDCAENGKEACAQFEAANGAYDLVFMDIHMPEMDGYQATRCIRAMSVPNAQTVPIVAMTANVLKEDIEMSLEAGMNAHVGKPLDMAEVYATLERYLGAGEASPG